MEIKLHKQLRDWVILYKLCEDIRRRRSPILFRENKNASRHLRLNRGKKKSHTKPFHRKISLLLPSHSPQYIFFFYSKTMKFNKLKYHIIFLRQAEVQGFEGFGGSILLQFSFIQGNWYYDPQEKKWSNIWAADNHLLLGQRNQKRIMKWNL